MNSKKSRTQKRIESWWRGQWLSKKEVVPEVRYDPLHKKMFFDSPAGQLEIRFKSRQIVAPFRDKYVNRFNDIENFRDFLKLYNEIQKEKIKGVRVIKMANIHTRLKGKLYGVY